MCVIGKGKVEDTGRTFMTMQESKGKVLTISDHEAPQVEQKCCSTLSLT